MKQSNVTKVLFLGLVLALVVGVLIGAQGAINQAQVSASHPVALHDVGQYDGGFEPPAPTPTPTPGGPNSGSGGEGSGG
jgi:hypothetical protein